MQRELTVPGYVYKVRVVKEAIQKDGHPHILRRPRKGQTRPFTHPDRGQQHNQEIKIP